MEFCMILYVWLKVYDCVGVGGWMRMLAWVIVAYLYVCVWEFTNTSHCFSQM